MTVLDPLRDDAGWRFTTEEPDPVNGFGYLSEVYRATDPAYEMRVTVPVLWDRARGQIVNNESADLLRMLNGWRRQGPDLYPAAYRDEIDSVNDRVYRTVNNGVYRAGFASRQDAYEEAFARAVRQPRLARAAPGRSPLPRGPPPDRGRHQAVRDARALRRCLRRPLQVQPAAHRRLSGALRVPP